jgi:hypothetical protein
LKVFLNNCYLFRIKFHLFLAFRRSLGSKILVLKLSGEKEDLLIKNDRFLILQP